MNALVLATTLSTFLLSNISGAATADENTPLLFQPSPTCNVKSTKLDVELSAAYLAYTVNHLDISVTYYRILNNIYRSAQNILKAIDEAFSQTNGTVFPLKRDTMERQKTLVRKVLVATSDLLRPYQRTIALKRQQLRQLNCQLDFSKWVTVKPGKIPDDEQDSEIFSFAQLDIETKALTTCFQSTKMDHVKRMISCLDEYIKQLARIRTSYTDQNDVNQKDQIRRIERDIAQAACEKGEFAALIAPSN